ncbi:hypothetical protein D3C86_1745200 [compost metagenome]
MNVKSRAQLIVWCLPHLGFVESEMRAEASNQGTAAATAYNNNAPQTIPAGSATVAGATTLPGGGMNRNGGNSDIGI